MIKRNFKKQYTLKSMAFILALFMVTGLFTACGKADENVPFDYATGSDGLREEIPESLSYTVESGGRGAVKVDAKVYSEGYGQVATYKLEKRDKNDEWIKSYAEKLFDNGEYINVKPRRFRNLEELESEKQFWEERLIDLDEGSTGYARIKSEIDALEYDIINFSESNYIKYPEGQVIFDTDYSADTGYSETAQLRGEVDGNVWLLNYGHSVDENGKDSWSPALYGSCLEKMDGISSLYEAEDAGTYKNKCDRAQAETDAIKLINRLGFDNMECVKMTEILPYYMSEPADCFDGYCFVYGPSLNGIKLFSGTGSGASTDGEYIAIQPYVCILVNSEGAYSFCIMEDYVIEDVLSEDSQMISFQQIDNIAHTEFEKMMEEQSTGIYDDAESNFSVIRVEFEYLCVTYDGISYAMIPVWTYYREWFNGMDTVLRPVVIVNALDGAVIPSAMVYFDWEYYQIMKY